MQNAMCASSSTPSFGGALNHVLPVHSPRKCLVLHLLANAPDLHVRNRLARLHQRAGGQKARKLVAGKQRLRQVRLPRHPRVLRVAQDRRPHRLRPTQPFQLPHAYKRVLLRRRVPLVVKVVQQRRRRVELDQLLPLLPASPSRSASASPHAITQASTPSACFRRLSLAVHSVKSCQACSRPYLFSPLRPSLNPP